MRFRNTCKTSVTRSGCIRALLALGLPCAAGAQSAKDSSLYVQAQQMVANGDAAGGRRLADSVAGVAPTGSVAYAEGLFWRATLAESVRDSEHGYRQIIVDYPLSGRVPDALLRIGQLESARGDNAAALQHFQRLVLEHPQSALRPEASYWVAHMYFDSNDAARGCSANADALASVRPSNIELKNRIDFQQQRCRGVVLVTNSTPAPASVPVPVNKVIVAESRKAVAKTVPKIAIESVTEKPAVDRSDTSMNATMEPRTNSKGSTVVSRAPTREEVARALASATSDEPKSEKGSYAVQVAAFHTKPPATLLVEKLRSRGYNSYIDGKVAPYRVRIGHYPSHTAATAELVKLKAKRIDGFVTER